IDKTITVETEKNSTNRYYMWAFNCNDATLSQIQYEGSLKAYTERCIHTHQYPRTRNPSWHQALTQADLATQTTIMRSSLRYYTILPSIHVPEKGRRYTDQDTLQHTARLLLYGTALTLPAAAVTHMGHKKRAKSDLPAEQHGACTIL